MGIAPPGAAPILEAPGVLAANAPAVVHSRSDFVVIEQPACSSGATALFDLATEPFIVINRTRQQVQCDLIDRASRLPTLRGESCRLVG